MYNFKDVIHNLGGWMYMLYNGKVVHQTALVIIDAEDEATARSFGLTEEEINQLRI